jgi:type VI secretion system secreted protein VgrG
MSAIVDGLLAAGRTELAALAAGLLSQKNRLLAIETALPSAALVVERLRGVDAVNALGEFSIDCLSPSAHLDLAPLIGEEVTLRLAQGDGTPRTWHGYVMQAAALGADGGLARYRLTLEPWLALLGHRRDSFIFQDATAIEVVEEVFKDYPQAHWRVEVTETLRQRSLCTQYRETDLDFVLRLLAEEGLSFHFEHDASASAGGAQAQARHCLVITDRAAKHPDLGTLRFSRPVQGSSGIAALVGSLLGANEDTITAFAAHRQVRPNAVALGSWNYKQLTGTSAQDASALAQGEIGPLETYDGSGAYRYENTEHASRAALLALQAHEQGLKTFDGDANVRALAPWAQFELSDHPLYGAAGVTNALLHGQHARDDARFCVLAVEHEAANNLGAQAARLMDAPELEAGSYCNHFSAVLVAVPVVPAFKRRPTAAGLQTAIVVGLDGEALTTDRDQRVKVQFPWQRGQHPLPGGLPHDTPGDADGNAPGNEQSGTWVRVATPSAGANWGSTFTPRLGAEVLVDFIETDIDRPLIIGQLYNGQDPPVFAAGVDSGINHSGTVSGLHVPTLDQADWGQWVLDDATGQLRMRLATSYRASELGLGHLIQQGPTTAQRGAWRGAGYELVTQGWATVRAGQGVLLSSTTRAQNGHSVEGTQMDVAEALAQLKAAQDLGQRLGEAAASAQAAKLGSHTAGQAWEQTLKGLDPTQDGKYDGPVNGQEAKKAQAGSRTLGEPVERFAKPYVVLDTPSTAAFVSPRSTAVFAGQDLSLVAQGDVQLTAAHTYSSVSGQTTSWYTHSGGIQAKAANGPFSLRAHTDALDVLADQDIQVTSSNDEIRIVASTSITLTAGQAQVKLEGANIDFVCPGSFTVKGATHDWSGGGSGEATLPALPQGLASEKPNFLELNYHDEWLQPVAGAPYRVVFEDGTVREGQLDADGHARLDGVPNQLARVYYGEDPRAPEARVELPPNRFQGGSTTNEEAVANLERYFEEAERFWSEQATGEQREVRAELNAGADEPDGENLWHYLDEAQQQAMTEQLRGGQA